MGIKGDLDKTFKEDEKCAPAIGIPYPVKPDTVFIGDFTGSPYYTSNGFEETKHLMSIRTLGKVWIDIVRRPIDTQGVTIMCIVKDISSLVPCHKQKEQKRRQDSLGHNKSDSTEDKKSKREITYPYHENTTITMDGVTEPGEPLNPNIDMKRLRITRGKAKSQYWDLLYTFTSEYREWPDYLTIIFDYRGDGPRYIIKNQAKGMALERLRHHFGEGDMMIPFYLRWFRDYENILVWNDDSDQQVIILNYLHAVKSDHKHKQLILQRSRRGGGVNTYGKPTAASAVPLKYNDMLKLYEGIGPERMDGFQAMLVLAGTDYVEKKLVSDGIGSQWILNYALEHGTDMKAFDLSPMLVDTEDTWAPAIGAMTWMDEIRTLTSPVPTQVNATELEKASLHVAQLLTVMIKKLYRAYKVDMGKKKMEVPTKFDRHAIEMIAWNIQYWNPNWNNVVRNAREDLKVLSATFG